MVRYLFDDTMLRTIPETSKLGRKKGLLQRKYMQNKNTRRLLKGSPAEGERKKRKEQSPVALAYFLWHRGRNAGSELTGRNVWRIFQVESSFSTEIRNVDTNEIMASRFQMETRCKRESRSRWNWMPFDYLLCPFLDFIIANSWRFFF